MTRHARLSCIASIALLGVTATASQAAPVALNEIRQNLFAACFVTDDVGWVVGELGRILRTEDGGTSWTRQDAGVKKPFLAASCVDPNTAWIGGKGAILYRTTDGGTTWQLLTPNTTKHIFDIKFVSPTRGVAVGDWGLLMYSEDGGTTWTIVGIPEDFVLSPAAEDIGLEPGDIILYAVTFPDRTHGWAVGEFGTILSTADGGRTWHQQRAPVDSTLFGAYFEDPRQGWAVGMDAVIIRTTDGGRTWRQIRSPMAQRSFYDIAVVGRYGWVAGDSGTLLKTRDQGHTWEVEPLPIELAANWFRSVRLLPSGRGFIVGAEGLLFAVDSDNVRDLRRDKAHLARRGPS